jgi:hypothetical protein
MRGERLHHRDTCDGDALREEREDVPASLDVGSGVHCGARIGCKAGPGPAAPGRRLNGGSKAEVIPARCTARRNIPFRMSWRSVSCADRARHHMAW